MSAITPDDKPSRNTLVTLVGIDFPAEFLLDPIALEMALDDSSSRKALAKSSTVISLVEMRLLPVAFSLTDWDGCF